MDNRGKLYVRRRFQGKTLYLHRVIQSLVQKQPFPDYRYVDHLNNDGLDNRRANLRWANAAMNARNTARVRPVTQHVRNNLSPLGLVKDHDPIPF